MLRVTFPPLAAGEKRTVYFPFLAGLAVGETISTKVVAASVYSGTDASPEDLISGSAGSAGTTVSQLIDGTAAVLGVVYHLVCTITTSAGQTLQSGGYLVIIPPTP